MAWKCLFPVVGDRVGANFNYLIYWWVVNEIQLPKQCPLNFYSTWVRVLSYSQPLQTARLQGLFS